MIRLMTILAAALALLAAVLFAVASAAQQRAAAAVPDEGGGLRLMGVLLRNRLWWTGTLCDASGFVCQAAALGIGSLLLVQPLLVTTLLFALPLGARWAHRRLRRSDLIWAALLAGALAVFVISGEPTAGLDRAPPERWLPAGLVLGTVLVVCLLVAATRRGTTRAVLLAVCVALAYAVTDALTKGAVSQLDDGVYAMLRTWELYGLAVASIAGTILQQQAFQAGNLGASLPTITVGEPVVAVVLGVTVLEEQLQSDGAEWALIAVLVVVMVVATVALARSAARTPQAASAPA
jgi:drug/metabolite transporter (DMT)-like permease